MFFAPHTLPASEASTAVVGIDLYRWLLVLGFPPELAAAKAMPGLFREPASPDRN